jgi:transmembrane sensor
MTRAHEHAIPRTAEDIEQEAAEWLMRVDRDGGPEVSRALAAWLGAHPRHRAAFLRISTAWRRADTLRRLADPSETPDMDLLAPERPPAPESITEPAHAETLAPVIPMRPRASRRRWALPVAIAAAIVVSLLLGIAAWVERSAEATPTYVTGVGEFHRVALPDGSAVSLNTATKVRVAYSAEERRVELLQGEAQFEVASEAQRPFIVSAGDSHVRVLGTQFVVRLRSASDFDVLVSEGRVSIDAPAQTLVSAGQMALVRDGRITTRLVDDMSRRVAWTTGVLIFNGETLADAVAEFNRYNRRQLVITDRDVASKTIGGAFKATSPDRFATALKNMFHIEVRVDEDTTNGEIRLSSGP